MTHGENLRVLIFEEITSEAESLASLQRESACSLHMAVISEAGMHGKQCNAECVEKAGDLALLWQYGVDIIQGSFLQEPNRQPGYDFTGKIA